MPIHTRLTVAPHAAADAEFLAVPFGPDLEPAVELPIPLAALLAHYQVKGEPGEVLELPVAHGDGVRRILLYGIGDDLRKAGAALGGRVKGRPSLTILLPPSGDLAALVESALLAVYTFTIGEIRTKAVEEIVFVGGDAAAIRRGEAAARATAVARDLVNTPASVKTPGWLAAQAVEFGAGAGLGVRVDTELTGFGGIRAVGQGSANPPCLVEMTYEPASYDRHVVLVGKGITFDSGGLSLKTSEGMKTMKTDMAGGAAIIAAMGALAEFGSGVRVTGLIACAENAFSGSSQRPSDVIVQYGGRTVEVLNTDAEGRLVLADALAYADAELNPDALVDIATLTGAAKVALGAGIGALYANDESLAAELLAASERTGDRLWRMPLIDDYLSDLDSDVADLANVDKRMSGVAGSVAAALFLREFVGKRPWAHLDIAGPARAEKGATGFGVRMLLDWLS
ncbi:leucyl aminopeptidase [Acrocarpospora corrugata]|uniref:Probable cytosol aminopeptidase n=1 Tax=Acrocarpospora corrugata TaxID=35763 RepID=A0A5M3W448_9ACTN|nr:M17 family peptidase N-terminal domain-containing protein [Acrocarpospora corrugata]GES03069.1 leucyl aminopeptidase [Acrocarpospora corrugata]